MAQLIRKSKSSEHSRPQTNRSFDHILQRDATRTRSSDHEDHHKKSVLMKVKEKAKKLGRSLSGKKKHGMEIHNDYTTHSGGDKFEDAIEDHENPEYLGAPMYESELSSDRLKQTSQQHPRANPVVPDNHALSSYSKTEANPGKEKPISIDKKIAQSVDKLAPAAEKGSNTTHSVSSKITGLAITNPNEKETEAHTGGTHVAASAATGSGISSRRPNDERLKDLEMNQNLEPGLGEKALSPIISESASPRKSPGQGVVEKVKEAVSSLLWHEEEEEDLEPTIKNTDKSSQNRETNYTTNPTLASKVTNPSPVVPVSTSTKTSEVTAEQTHGRILQTN